MGAALAGLARCDEAAGDLDLAGQRFTQVLDLARGSGDDVQRLLAEADAVRNSASRSAPPYERCDLEALAFSGSSSS